MIVLIKSIYYLINDFLSLIIQFKNRYTYFVLPNRLMLLRRKVQYKTIPVCSQLVVCEGYGMVRIGFNCYFGYKLGGFRKNGCIELQARYHKSTIIIGDNVRTNNNLMICAANNIEIGDNTLIGQSVSIMDHEAHSTDPERRKELGDIGIVKIGHNVWIGTNVIILKNTIIGDHTIVAAGAVVSGEFPKNVIIGGVPARIIKQL
jgi:acetyltransferase-like isoleucine patch superfamily enzyme